MSIDPISFFQKSLILVYCIIAIIYYFINMCFFVDNKKLKKGMGIPIVEFVCEYKFGAGWTQLLLPHSKKI
ncbi:MAG: hypothetical protein L6U99_07450 [Clostridium sp.]|nr:MAG: hypothetical protein L6U99_07450 [Clostridium sp.]